MADTDGDPVAAAMAASAHEGPHLDNPVMEIVLDANGIARDTFINRRNQITKLGMFLMVLDTMDFCPFFQNLRELELMHVQLSEIANLERCVKLEVLRLMENRITEIQGLRTLLNLRELYLGGNQIGRIEGLENNQNLEVLWLAENRIPAIENISHLTKLRKLWLPGNSIAAIGSTLEPHVALEELNLAGNMINSFRDIPTLDRLPNLRKVYFCDPCYGSNPVCSLCNYSTFTLYHLHRIKVLDYESVLEEQRHVAEATFVKKKIYYNMRIKTLKRNASNVVKKAQQFRSTQVGEMQLTMNVLVRMVKELERELAELQYCPDSEARNSAGGDGDDTVPLLDSTDAIKEKLQAVGGLLQARFGDISFVDESFRMLKNNINATVDAQVRKLMIELQTGGNVRLEDGRTTEVWYQSCVELVKTRFFPQDYEAFGIKDLRVTKVIRVHNRALRTRFEKNLEALVDTTDPTYKRALEYLFYVDVPSTRADKGGAADDEAGAGGSDGGLKKEIDSIVEFGFQHTLQPGEGVPLTNSVFFSQQQKMLEAFEAGDLGGKAKNVKEGVLQGRLLVTKVFLGKCAAEKTQRGENGTTPTGSTGKSAVFEPVANRPDCPVLKDDYANTTNSVFRCRPGDNKQKVWFCFEPLLALPEYIVEFSFIPASPAVPLPPAAEWLYEEKADEVNEVLGKLFPQRSHIDTLDLKLFSPYLLSYVEKCNGVAAAERDSRVVSAPPIPRQRQPVTAMTHDAIVAATGYTDPEGPVYLNMMGNHIRRVEAIAPWINLQTVNLAFNELQSLDGLAPLTNLTHLDVSFNLIKRIERLKGHPHLRTLHINNNLLYRLDDILTLAQDAPTLAELSIANNAVTDSKGFDYWLLSRLPELDMLDGRPTARLREAAQAAPTVLSVQLVLLALLGRISNGSGGKEGADGTTNKATPGGKVGGTMVGVLDATSSIPLQLRTMTQIDVSFVPTVPEELALQRATDLSITGLRLGKIRSLEKLKSLRRLNLTDNEIPRVENLQTCTRLEELRLEDNKLTKVEGLSQLVNLRKLELGRNRISKIDGLEALPHLSLVSLEDNELTSLQPLSHASGLMELYAANNKVDSAKDVGALRELAKLIIVDVSGNPCVSDTNFRPYAVFTLKKLKVLNGVSIDATESAAARELFAGRVTTDLLTERIGENVSWATITELSLSGCALKEVSLLEAFTSLQHLKLDHNNLSDLSGLRALPTLLSLNLSFNKIAAQAIGKHLDKCTQLESLSLEANSISNMAALQLQLPGLRFLNVKCNELVKLEGFEGLPALRELIADKNRIRSVDAHSFAANEALGELRLEDNAIKTIEGLRQLSSLRRLTLTANRISELAELDRLDGLQQLREINALSNPVARKCMYRPTIIHRLVSCEIIDGREVSPEERERALVLFQQEHQLPPNVLVDTRVPLGPQPPGMPGGAKATPTQPTAVKLMTLDGAPDGGSAIKPQMVTGPGMRGRPPQQTVGKGPGRTSSAEARQQQVVGVGGRQGDLPRPRGKQSGVPGSGSFRGRGGGRW